MIIGKWNKSVILSYVGLLLSVCGMYFFIQEQINYGIVCLMFAGVCDMFDGTIARRCKRTKEEKQFGIELDSLIDVFDFVALPIVLFYSIGFNKWFLLPVLGFYAICGVARLAYFNIIVENDNKPVPFYHGLPVTYAALIFPIAYMIISRYFDFLFLVVFGLLIFIVSVLFIVNIKVPKPKLKASIGLLLLAIVVAILYLFVL